MENSAIKGLNLPLPNTRLRLGHMGQMWAARQRYQDRQTEAQKGQLPQ